MSSNNDMRNKKTGGFLGIPDMGIKKAVFKPKEPMLNSMEKPMGSTPSNTPGSSASSSPTSNDQAMLDENRKNCVAAADEKIKEANEDKKQCDIKFPKKKKMFYFFGGKKRSYKKKGGKNARKTKRRKHRKSASK
jgi:hypothetical protein